MSMWIGGAPTVIPNRAPTNGGRPARRRKPRPRRLVAHTDMAAAVYGSVDALEPDLRHTVQLHYYQALTLQETADALGVATSTVKYRLRQALAELQRKLSPNELPECHRRPRELYEHT